MGVYPTLPPRRLVGRRHAPAPFPFAQPGLRMTHLGRGAVWLALRALGLGPGRRLAMPSYHCGAEVDAARLAGIEVLFYRVAPSLEVDGAHLAEVASRADAAYLISHFGFPPPSRPAGVAIVEDVAHGLFSSGATGRPLGEGADASVFCPRKSLGVPDGGALLLGDATPAGAATLAEGEGGRPPAKGIVRSVASLAAGRAALSPRRTVRQAGVAALSASSRADAAAAAGRLSETVIGGWDMDHDDMRRAAGRPSRVTERLVAAEDGDGIRERRRANYQVLADALGDMCPPPYRSLPEGVCPLYFPVRCPDRDSVIVDLLRRGVRPIEIWPVAHPLLDGDLARELAPLRRELMALPVHQDLQPWHVEVVVEAACAVLRP